ncbi:hypothetical protein CC80DRAFT_542255 [Byssothecium circinans]|uniref:Uncharacterized protein n=1 Tax=Byssothecium circinans TaxID=147558 RepID=A0A6A5UH57_9PLEO|nr:hypothetical protein CC80DRAFT_542255 [Byssothecium circinans]
MTGRTRNLTNELFAWHRYQDKKAEQASEPPKAENVQRNEFGPPIPARNWTFANPITNQYLRPRGAITDAELSNTISTPSYLAGRPPLSSEQPSTETGPIVPASSPNILGSSSGSNSVGTSCFPKTLPHSSRPSMPIEGALHLEARRQEALRQGAMLQEARLQEARRQEARRQEARLQEVRRKNALRSAMKRPPELRPLTPIKGARSPETRRLEAEFREARRQRTIRRNERRTQGLTALTPIEEAPSQETSGREEELPEEERPEEWETEGGSEDGDGGDGEKGGKIDKGKGKAVMDEDEWLEWESLS